MNLFKYLSGSGTHQEKTADDHIREVQQSYNATVSMCRRELNIPFNLDGCEKAHLKVNIDQNAFPNMIPQIQLIGVDYDIAHPSIRKGSKDIQIAEMNGWDKNKSSLLTIVNTVVKDFLVRPPIVCFPDEVQLLVMKTPSEKVGCQFSGTRLSRVTPDSPAAKAGLLNYQNCTCARVNNVKVTTTEEIVSKSSLSWIVFSFHRDFKSSIMQTIPELPTSFGLETMTCSRLNDVVAEAYFEELPFTIACRKLLKDQKDAISAVEERHTLVTSRHLQTQNSIANLTAEVDSLKDSLDRVRKDVAEVEQKTSREALLLKLREAIASLEAESVATESDILSSASSSDAALENYKRIRTRIHLAKLKEGSLTT